MGRLLATTVYLDESQKKGLYRLAKTRGSRFSEEIRSAIQHHLASRGRKADVDAEELRQLASEADQCVDRMLNRLEDTNRRLDSIIRTVGRSNRRALGGAR